MKINGIELKWLGHSGFLIKNNKVIYIDPYNIKDDAEKADIILITHSHYDHCSIADLNKVVKDGTKIIATVDCQSHLGKITVPVKVEIVHVGDELEFGDLKVLAVPAYNIDKHFHPKEEGLVGYILKLHGITVYHAGDTDLIPEMQKLTGYKQEGKEFIALLPVGGRFTMTAEEASEAANVIKPTLAIPMHYGSVVGTEYDAKEFVEMCREERINAEILEKE